MCFRFIDELFNNPNAATVLSTDVAVVLVYRNSDMRSTCKRNEVCRPTTGSAGKGVALKSFPPLRRDGVKSPSLFRPKRSVG